VSGVCGFCTLGIYQSFQSAREANDILYSALLPVAKHDVVKGKYQFVMTVELCGFALITVLTLATVPDIEKCLSLAEVYGTTIDSLIRTESVEGLGIIPPVPRGKNIWGSVAVGERGQIVIPKGARDLFGLTGGQHMVVLSDENGIALIPEKEFMSNMRNAMKRSLEKQD
jgi:AbrB family looped-hinge helix DNA binding protein